MPGPRGPGSSTITLTCVTMAVVLPLSFYFYYWYLKTSWINWHFTGLPKPPFYYLSATRCVAPVLCEIWLIVVQHLCWLSIMASFYNVHLVWGMLCVSMHKCLNVCVPEQFIATCNRLQSFAGLLFSNPKVRCYFYISSLLWNLREEGKVYTKYYRCY